MKSKLDVYKILDTSELFLSAKNNFSAVDVAMATSPSDKIVFNSPENSPEAAEVLHTSSRISRAVLRITLQIQKK